MATTQDNSLHNGLSVIAFDGIKLAFALDEVMGVQRTYLLDYDDKPSPFALCSIVHAGRRWPVFALGRDYELLTKLPAERNYCVCLSADDGQTGLALACETVNAIPLEPNVNPTPVPVCVQRTDSPLQAWHWHREHILPISSAPSLTRYLSGLMEGHNG